MIYVRRTGGSSDFVKKIFAKVSSVFAKVGWSDSENSAHAYINEFGGFSSDGEHEIPPRPFIGPAMQKTAEDKEAFRVFKRNFMSGDIERAYRDSADVLKRNIEASIDELQSPKLAKYTISERLKKGASHYVAGLEKPLIETGKMRNSIQVRLEEKNGGL